MIRANHFQPRPKRHPAAGLLGQRPRLTIGCLTVSLFILLQNVCASEGNNDGLPALKRAVVRNYAAIVLAATEDSLAGARHLQKAVDDFLASPSQATLQSARAAWLAARVPYAQIEVCRFYDGPLDQVESMVNSWPIDENYIDYTVGNPDAGLVNQPQQFPAISRELIVSLNLKEGKKNVSTGFHAIEFLLWGQDLSATGPGDRSWRDYATGTKNSQRRRQYLRIVTDLLVEHLQTVADAWRDGGQHNYRSQFLAMDPDAALGDILKGAGVLSGREVSGERLTVPYETKDQEDEQDCFSDNTHNEFIYDAVGIQNVYLGRYAETSGQTIKGPGLYDLLAKANPALADELSARVQDAVVCAHGIPKPFDQAILGADATPGRIAIKKAIDAFQVESDALAKAAKELSIPLNL